MSKVIGIGWAKTGTTTLGVCLETLGYDHQSLDLRLVEGVGRGDLSTIMAIAEQKESFDDWPWSLVYQDLDRAFPGSRFILTRRDPANWLRSYRNMLNNEGTATDEMNDIRRNIYELPFPDVSDEALLARYERHYADVENYFADRPNDLLSVDWAAGDGWDELCAFLGKDLPREPFPHANHGIYRHHPAVQRVIRVVDRLLRFDRAGK